MLVLFYALSACSAAVLSVSLLTEWQWVQWPEWTQFWYWLSERQLSQPLYLFCLAFLAAYSLQAVTGQYSGTLWGVQIPASRRVMLFRLLGVAGGLLFLVAAVNSIGGVIGFLVGQLLQMLIGFFVIVFTGDVGEYFGAALLVLLYCAVAAAAFIISFCLASHIGLKLLRKSSAALRLGSLPIFQDIDVSMPQTRQFFVDGRHIVLLLENGDTLDFAYERYNLPELTRPVTASETKNVAAFEVGLIGLYFMQKYPGEFAFSIEKATVEGDPGTPGQSVTLYGSDGAVYSGTVGGAPGTPDKHPFNGYHFVRKGRRKGQSNA